MSHIHPQARTALLQKQISLLRKSISKKNLAQYEAHDCCARVEFWKECRFMQQSPVDCGCRTLFRIAVFPGARSFFRGWSKLMSR